MIKAPAVRLDFRRSGAPSISNEASALSKLKVPAPQKRSVVEEEDEEEDPGKSVSGSGAGGGVMWDAAKGCLVERAKPDKKTNPVKSVIGTTKMKESRDAQAQGATPSIPAGETASGESGDPDKKANPVKFVISMKKVEASRDAQAPQATPPLPAGEIASGGCRGGEPDAGASACAEGSVEEKEDSAGEEEDGNEGDESESGSEESDLSEEAASRRTFLESASTPELIRQAVAVGGDMARSVTNRWVLDQATSLYFRQNIGARQMLCWNGDQGCMYCWVERGKLDFLWASPESAGGPPPANAGAAKPQLAPATAQIAEAEAGAGADVIPNDDKADRSQGVSLWVTVIPPKILNVSSVQPGKEKASIEMELNQKALGAVIGKAGATIKELERSSGATLTTMQPAEGEKIGCLRIDGTKAQVEAAKLATEQRLVVALGADAVEKIQRKASSELLDQKRKETGASAGKAGVAGLSEFCQKYGVQAVWARKLSKLDAQLQRHLLRHFQPKKAKAMAALRKYVDALMKHPQRWRLEALYEDGELDGEVCETVPIGTDGAVVGQERGAGADAQDTATQMIELEHGAAAGREVSRYFGDVQSQHCRFLPAAGDHYVLALESEIGTIVDGQKCRPEDGPMLLRDGSTAVVGRYVLYCEVGTPAWLQDRRARLLAGKRGWVKAAQGDDESKEPGAEATQGGQESKGEGAGDAVSGAADGTDPAGKRPRPNKKRKKGKPAHNQENPDVGVDDPDVGAPEKRARAGEEDEDDEADDAADEDDPQLQMEREAMQALGLPVNF